jgi:hypothetical protein
MAAIFESGSQPWCEADLAVNAPQDHGAEIRRQRTAIEAAAHGQTFDGGKAELFLGRILHRWPRLVSSEALLV